MHSHMDTDIRVFNIYIVSHNIFEARQTRYKIGGIHACPDILELGIYNIGLCSIYKSYTNMIYIYIYLILFILISSNRTYNNQQNVPACF